MAERVLIAMSGGVDSSVAAARLVAQGFEVIGLTLHLWDQPEGARRGRCCAPEDVHDARRVADQLGIAHYALDRRELFEEHVVNPFIDDYLAGRTPSPCARCNQQIKFPLLMRMADLLEARWVATGHYARLVKQPSGVLRVARGLDRQKDQSYFLYALGQSTLSRLMLPLGEDRKETVRSEALQASLIGAGKGESQDLCFVNTASYIDFVEEHAANKVRPGPIVDRNGQVLGEHAGVHRFTLGQRKGVGLAAGKPLFVTAIDADSGAVVVDEEAALWAKEVRVSSPALAADVQLPMKARVRVRYRHEGEMATLLLDGSELRIVFDQPVRAPSPGQVAVAFDQELVVGGGPITEVLRASVATEPSAMAP